MLKVEIHFKGQITDQWSEWFGGLTVCHSDDREATILSGLVADSSALYGIIARLRDLGLQLTSLNSEEIKENFYGEFTMKNNTKGLIWFLAIAFAITWASILAIYLIGDISSSGASAQLPNPMVGLLSVLGTFGPAIAAFVVRKWVTREGFKDAGLRFNFRTGWAYYLWAVLAPLTGGVITILAARTTGGDVSSLSAISATDIVSWLVGSLIWTPILFGEEFGWRGYLQQRLALGRPLIAAIWMGLIWGIYHYAHVLSGITMSANPLALLIYPFYCIMGSIMLGWLRDKSQSVWPACLAHAVGNVIVSGLTDKLLPNVSDISVFVFTLIGEAAVALVLVLGRRVPWRDAETQQVGVQA